MTRSALYNMVEQQIRPWNVHSDAILKALHDFPRADFLPDSLKPFAYMDMELPLKIAGKDTHTQLMAPRMIARILQEIDLKGHEHVGLVGLGDGYLATLIAYFSRHVTAYEIDADIMHFAQNNLNEAGVHNISIEAKDGLSEGAEQYDVMILGGSINELNTPLLNKLKIGGQMFAVIGHAQGQHSHAMQACLITRTQVDEWTQRTVFETVLAPLTQNTPTTTHTFTF